MTKARFDYFVCIDLVVVACILVIAGRPDGLAITISAFIVAVCAVVYRCVTRTRSVAANTTRAPAAPPPDVDQKFSPTTFHPSETGTSDSGSKRSSWLRESD
ncbi:MAG: hypothetical protein JF619_09355 [Massilia sp.]|nr:hypothetical protein [Massilia sp.]